MNAKETEQVLSMIAAHYWQRVRKGPDEMALMVATWAEVFRDIPRESHVMPALAEWFGSKEWPPQASELKALAMDLGGPTPLMVAEAEAWKRERAFSDELRLELNEACGKHG